MVKAALQNIHICSEIMVKAALQDIHYVVRLWLKLHNNTG